MFKFIFLHENQFILFQISVTFVANGPINDKPALVQIMAWCQTGDKPLSEPMIALLTDTYLSPIFDGCM